MAAVMESAPAESKAVLRSQTPASGQRRMIKISVGYLRPQSSPVLTVAGVKCSARSILLLEREAHATLLHYTNALNADRRQLRDEGCQVPSLG
jgi:hypothetical protein